MARQKYTPLYPCVPHGVCLTPLFPGHDPAVATRLFANIIKTDWCWEWQGGGGNDEYGRLSYRNTRVYTHRLSWLLHYGTIPTSLCVLHKCDNRRCVRPDHLFLGTKGDNWRDACLKRRAWVYTTPEKLARGERNGQAKLTAVQALDIYERVQQGTRSQKGLARDYHVSKFAIYAIVRGLTWGHITGAMPPGSPPREGAPLMRWCRFPAIWVHFDATTEPPRLASWRAWRRIVGPWRRTPTQG